MQIYYHTQEGYDLYDQKFFKHSIDQIYKDINRKNSYPCFLITKYLYIKPTENLKMIELCYKFGKFHPKNELYDTGISNESFSFRIYVNKHGSGNIINLDKTLTKGRQYYFKNPKTISKYQPIPLGKIRVRHFKGYGE